MDIICLEVKQVTAEGFRSGTAQLNAFFGTSLSFSAKVLSVIATRHDICYDKINCVEKLA